MSKMRRGGRACALVVLLLATLTVAASARALRCARCGLEIEGRYVEAEGQVLHPQCFVCATCGEPITGPYRFERGAFHHAACWDALHAARCGVCGKPVSGRVRTIGGVSYHEACYAESKAPTCAACGQKILGAYLVNWWEEAIHKEHEGSIHDCSSCGRFAVPGRSFVLPDGRLQCSVCRKDAVRDPRRAEALIRRVAGILGTRGIAVATPLTRISIELIDRNRLASLAGVAGDPHGLYSVESQSVLGLRLSERSTIYFLSDLPADLFEAVAAHELFHVWQHERHADGGPVAWREGSAEVASELVLASLDSDLARYLRHAMQQNEDPAYGDGYRRAQKLLAERGIEAFLAEVVRRGAR